MKHFDYLIFKKRREILLNTLPEGVFIIHSSTPKTRSHDTEYVYRQDSNFYYLSGFEEPGSALVFKKSKNAFETIIYLRAKDSFQEMWSGRRLGIEGAKETLGFDQAKNIANFDEDLESNLMGHRALYIDLFSELPYYMKIRKSLRHLQERKKLKSHIPLSIHHFPDLIHRMRLIKDDFEINQMKKAQEISYKAHSLAMSMASPSRNERDINAIIDYTFKRLGAKGAAYENIVASGDNATILHYTENNRPLGADHLLLIDAGAEFQNYAADVTRTFPVSGKFSPLQRDLYEIVLKSQNEAIKLVKPGSRLKDIHHKASIILIDGLIALGLLKGSAEEIFSNESHKKFYPHGTGHWLGLDVHDTNPYHDDHLEDIVFSKGMVFTVEPGLYFQQDDTDTPDKFRGIGIRIEDDILVTEEGHLNLTEKTPKSIKDIEEMCAQDFDELRKKWDL